MIQDDLELTEQSQGGNAQCIMGVPQQPRPKTG